MQSKFKKLFAVLILTGAVLAFCSPGFAGDRAFWDEASQTYKIGSTADFLGINWTLWKTDGEYAYVIVTEPIKKNRYDTQFLVHNFDYKANRYQSSEIRKLVRTSGSSLENTMMEYDPEWSWSGYVGTGKSSKMTWEQINGGEDRRAVSNEYIAQHYMWDVGITSDKLFLLSTDEAKELPQNVRTIGVRWWLRSPRPNPNLKTEAMYVDVDGDMEEFTYVSDECCVRPALQISLKSPLFTGNDAPGYDRGVKPAGQDGAEEQGKQEEQKAVWKVGGEWNYTITLPEFTDTFDGVPVKISAEQTGIITITAADSEKEAGKERIAGGAVESVRSSLKYELPDGTVETFSSYFEGPMDLGEKFKKDPYNPGEEVSFTAPLYYDTHEGEQQIVGFVSARYSQTEENKFEGTVTLSKTPGGTPIASGIFEAAKRSKDSSSGCNAGFGALALLGVLGMFYRKKK
ncbi:MAG: SYNERG-CTERM sorting domain-containing protein [Synergistaceae bacterium]|nr:SYNERG-CTERM sorting domain-containing protein [Candidatus Equadaptatus faecalis]